MNPILRDFPNCITTPRLLIRSPKPGDGKEVNAAILETFDSLHQWLPWAKEKPSLEESEENVRRSYARWILREDLQVFIFDRKSGRFAGGSGLHRINWNVPCFEIGYWVRKSFEGQGYFEQEGCLRSNLATINSPDEVRNTLIFSRLTMDGLPPLEIHCETKI